MEAAAVLLPLILLLHAVPSLANALVTDPLVLLERQEAQLRRLEALVESRSQTVSALESSISSPRFLDHTSPATSATETSSSGGDAAVAVTKNKTEWLERFHFLGAARLGSEAVCATILPYQDLDGLSKYFAIGDNRGRVYVFSSAGDVLIELPTHSDSPVTSMLSYLSFRRNESILFTGHADGAIASHHIWESAGNSEDWMTLTLASSRPFASGSRDLESPPVLVLEVHQVGRIRYVLAADGGRIRVFTENGTLYGAAIASSCPLAFMRQRLLFLTESGAGSLDLRSMSMKEIACGGLNGSLAKSSTLMGRRDQRHMGSPIPVI